MRAFAVAALAVFVVACGPLEPGPNICPLGADPEAQGCLCSTLWNELDDSYADYFGYAVCDGVCVDTNTDDEHCGGCGDGCYTAQHCMNGTCCGPGETSCRADQCSDLQTDSRNCGECGNRCPSGASCQDGVCICPPEQPDVCDRCVDLASSDWHCGACGVRCTGGSSCVGGACVCPSGQSFCDGVCIELSSNTLHCGSCGHRCADAASCEDGVCACPDPRHEVCEGACVDTLFDEVRCGGCDAAPCPEGTVCEDGDCVCPLGTQLCGEGCVQTGLDAQNCGGCGQICGEDQSCIDGLCAEGDLSPYVSVISRYQPGPSLYPCCSDYTGDGFPDSGVEHTGVLFGLQDGLDQFIVDDEATQLLVFDSPPPGGDEEATIPVSFTVWQANNDFDGDGEPDQPVNDRRDGYGLYHLTREVPVALFEGYVEGDTLVAYADWVHLPWPGLPGGHIVIEAALEGTLETGRGWASTESDHAVLDRVIRFGDLRLSGWIPLRSALDAMAQVLPPECLGCLETAPYRIIEQVEATGVTVTVERAETFDACGCQEEAFMVPLALGEVADVDTNGDGTPDAISVGLFLTIAPATLADPAFAP